MTSTSKPTIVLPVPFRPGYNHHACLKYIAVNLLGEDDHHFRLGVSTLARVFQDNGIASFYDDILMLSDQDILDLETQPFAGYTKGSGAVAPYNDPTTDPADDIAANAGGKISIFVARRITLIIAFYHYSSKISKTAVDLRQMSKAQFDEFRAKKFAPGKPIAPFGIALKEENNKEMADWQKTVKVDAKAFKEFCSDELWYAYKKHFTTTLEAQNLTILINPAHKPTNEDLYKNKQKWLYKVMQDCFKAGQAKTIVADHIVDKDTVAIWREISEKMDGSMAAQLYVSELSNYLTSNRLATNGWKGTQQAYIFHWKEQACRYQETAPEEYTQSQLVGFLEQSVIGVPNLEDVGQSTMTSRRVVGITTPLTLEELIQALLQKAQIYDQQIPVGKVRPMRDE